MADCTDAEDFVVLSRVRTGLKREFEFALKAQSEICGSLGRTRSRKSQNGPAWSPDKRSNKKLKIESQVEEECIDLVKSVRVAEESIDLISEEEAKSDVVDVEEPNREVDCCEEEESRRAKLEKEEEIKNGVIEVTVEDEVDKERKEKSEPQKTIIGTRDGKEDKVSKMDVGTGEKESELENATANVEEGKGKEDLVINSELCKRKPVFDSLKGNSKIGEVVKEEKPLLRYTRSKPKVEKVKEAVLDVFVDANDAKTGGDDSRVEGVDAPIMPEINVEEEKKVSKMDVGTGEKESELENATANVEEEKGKEDLVINSELCKGDSRKPVFDSLKGNSKIGGVVKEEKPLLRYTRSKPKVEKVKEAVLDVVVDANSAKTVGDNSRVEGVDAPIMPEINVEEEEKVSKMDVGTGDKESELENATANVEEEKGKEDFVINSELCKGDSRKPVFDSLKGNGKIGEVVEEEKPLLRYTRSKPKVEKVKEAGLDVVVDANDANTGSDDNRIEGVDGPIMPEINVATKSLRNFPAKAVLGDVVVVDGSDVKSGVDGDRVEGVDSPITPEITVAAKSVRNFPAEAVLGDAAVVDASDVKSGVDGDRVEGVGSPFTPEIIVASKSVRNSLAKAVLGDAVVVDASDVKSGVDGDRVEGVDSPVTPEIIVATKSVRNFPTKLKDLFDSGMLEGANVRYARSSKVTKGSGSIGLQGVIKGTGILCFCNACKGVNVITSTLFENHAGSSNKRPAEYIYLDNGHTLRDVMNVCKDNSLTKLEKALQLVIGSSMKKSSFCLNCRESITAVDSGKSMILCNSCVAIRESQDSSTDVADASDRLPKPTVVPKSQISASKCSSSQSKSQGRVTRKDLRMHKLVFEENGLPDGTELRYFVRGQKMLVGYKRGFGILCTCCNSEVSPSQFEAHAGWATRRKPFQHIYTSNGVSLHELSISLLKNRKFSTNENDNLCSICLDEGNLFCCNTCPRAFHTECVSLPSIPTGTWHCRYCQNAFQKEKFVERNANALAAGRVAGIDPIEQITKRCIRIIKTPETEVLSVCVLCRGHTFSKSGFGPRTVILCDQCEREYHVGCLRDYNMDDLKELPKGNWFCCTDCNRIHLALQKLIVRGEEKLPDSSLVVVKNKHEKNSLESQASLDIRWRVLSGKMISSDDTRVLLSKAVAIFHERFDPISDSGSSKGDLIPSMVYGRTVKGQDFGGMYCAILSVNQVVVSAGIFRIFGQEVAEIPLVATSTEDEGQGYFQCLFSCLEKLLGFLNVKNLVLPAADEAESIWTKKFGFGKMTKEEIDKYRRDYQMMVFQGTSLLQKPVSEIRLVRNSEHE